MHGAVVYQIGTDGKRKIIRFLSKKISKSEAHRDPHVKEAWAIVWTLKSIKDLVQSCIHKTHVITDQESLQWIKHARNPLVRRWVVEILQVLDYYVTYRPGKLNLSADSLTRVPCVEPGFPTDFGKLVATNYLLTATNFPENDRTRIWLSVEGDASALIETILTHGQSNTKEETNKVTTPSRKTGLISQLSIKQKRKIVQGPPSLMRIQSNKTDVAIIIPEASKTPSVARNLFAQEYSFAILMPCDLVHRIHTPSKEGPIDKNLRQQVKEAKYMNFLESNLCWIMKDWPGTTSSLVYFMEGTNASPLTSDLNLNPGLVARGGDPSVDRKET
jgi:hypothetical protein